MPDASYPVGLTFAQFRDLIRAVRRRQPFIQSYSTQEILNAAEPIVGERLLLQFWNEFQPRYLEKDDRDPQRWCLTDEARGLATKKLRRISAATLERLKADVIERARNSSRQTVSPLEVGQLIFFGSAIGPPKADYGDLDIVIRSIYQKRYGDWAQAVKMRPEWRNFDYSPDAELEKYIRSRNGFIHITSAFDFDHLGMTGEVVYEAPGWLAVQSASTEVNP